MEKSELKQQIEPSSVTRIKIAAFTMLLVYLALIPDTILQDSIMKSTCQLTVYLQEIKPSLEFPSKILSSILAYWLPGFLVYIAIFPPKFKKSQFSLAKNPKLDDVYHHPLTSSAYLISLWGLNYAIEMFMKAGFARGRPFIMCPEVKAWSCSCSYGMPSSHSSTAIAEYYILYHWVSHYIPNKVILRNILAGFCLFCGFGIPWSRIILGAHAWDQVLTGVVSGTAFVLAMPRDVFERITMNLLRSGKLAIASFIYLAVVVVGSIFLYFVNKTGPRNSGDWIVRAECPGCAERVIIAQMSNCAQALIFGLVFLGLSLNYSKFVRSQSRIVGFIEGQEGQNNNQAIKKSLKFEGGKDYDEMNKLEKEDDLEGDDDSREAESRAAGSILMRALLKIGIFILISLPVLALGGVSYWLGAFKNGLAAFFIFGTGYAYIFVAAFFGVRVVGNRFNLFPLEEDWVDEDLNGYDNA